MYHKYHPDPVHHIKTFIFEVIEYFIITISTGFEFTSKDGIKTKQDSMKEKNHGPELSRWVLVLTNRRKVAQLCFYTIRHSRNASYVHTDVSDQSKM